MSSRNKRRECIRQENEILVTALQKVLERYPEGNNVRWSYIRAINSIADFDYIIENEDIALTLKYIKEKIGKIIKKTLQEHNRYVPGTTIADQPKYVPPTPPPKQRRKRQKTHNNNNNSNEGDTQPKSSKSTLNFSCII